MRGSVYTMGDRLGLNNFALANVANSFVDINELDEDQSLLLEHSITARALKR